MSHFIIDLPIPPSVNEYASRLGNVARPVVTWRKECDGLLMSKGRLPNKLSGPVQAHVTWNRLYDGVRDIDNPLKPLLDYIAGTIVRGRIGGGLHLIDNDKMIKRLLVDFGDAPVGCRVLFERFRP